MNSQFNIRTINHHIHNNSNLLIRNRFPLVHFNPISIPLYRYPLYNNTLSVKWNWSIRRSKSVSRMNCLKTVEIASSLLSSHHSLRGSQCLSSRSQMESNDCSVLLQTQSRRTVSLVLRWVHRLSIAVGYRFGNQSQTAEGKVLLSTAPTQRSRHLLGANRRRMDAYPVP